MKFLCCDVIRHFGFVYRREKSQVDVLSVVADFGHVFVGLRMLSNAFNSCAKIDCALRFMLFCEFVAFGSQIAPSIVRPNHIDVVNLIFWPIASHHCPCNAVGKLWHSVDIDSDITVDLNSPSDISGFVSKASSLMAFLPGKNARFLIIAQEFAKFFYAGSNRHDLKVVENG